MHLPLLYNEKWELLLKRVRFTLKGSIYLQLAFWRQQKVKLDTFVWKLASELIVNAEMNLRCYLSLNNQM